MDINSVFGKELTDVEIKKIALERCEELEEKTSRVKEINPFDYKIYHGYISNQTQIIPSLMATNGVHVDDNKIYELLIKRLSKLGANVNLSTTPLILNQIQYVIDDYFGTGHNSSDAKRVYMNDAENISIKDFEGKNIAICHERAAVANNLLAFCGYDATLVMSKINGGAHAFNVLIDENGKRLLFDSMNPIIFEREKGYGRVAAMALLNEKEYNDIINHNEYRFDYKLTNYLLKSLNGKLSKPILRIYGEGRSVPKEDAELS